MKSFLDDMNTYVVEMGFENQLKKLCPEAPSVDVTVVERPGGHEVIVYLDKSVWDRNGPIPPLDAKHYVSTFQVRKEEWLRLTIEQMIQLIKLRYQKALNAFKETTLAGPEELPAPLEDAA